MKYFGTNIDRGADPQLTYFDLGYQVSGNRSQVVKKGANIHIRRASGRGSYVIRLREVKAKGGLSLPSKFLRELLRRTPKHGEREADCHLPPVPVPRRAGQAECPPAAAVPDEDRDHGRAHLEDGAESEDVQHGRPEGGEPGAAVQAETAQQRLQAAKGGQEAVRRAAEAGLDPFD